MAFLKGHCHEEDTELDELDDARDIIELELELELLFTVFFLLELESMFEVISTAIDLQGNSAHLEFIFRFYGLTFTYFISTV